MGFTAAKQSASGGDGMTQNPSLAALSAAGHPYEANRSVVLAGVGIHPGDYIFADHSGAVVIPADEVRTVLRGACQVTVEDAQSVAAIRNETPSTSPGTEH
jgi:regulator of RNase E activity RraA